MLEASKLEKNIEWLRSHGSPPVVYLTHLHIIKDDPKDEKMRKLWKDVQDSSSSREIFGKQRDDGSWFDGGSWAYKPSYAPKSGYTPVSPKYVTTVWLLAKLGEMGYSSEDPWVKKACEWVMRWQWPNGVLSEDMDAAKEKKGRPDPPNVPCRMSIQMEGLSKVGFGKDRRLGKSWELLLRWRREDNGWVDRGHLDGSYAPYKVWDRSCPWVSYFATSALFHSGVSEYRVSAKESLGFILWHMGQKDPDDLRSFFWHGHEPLKELLMMSELGFDPDNKEIQNLLDWLIEMYNPDKHHFSYKGKPYSKMTNREDGVNSRIMKYRMYHQAEDDWLTYYATRIMSNFQG